MITIYCKGILKTYIIYIYIYIQIYIYLYIYRYTYIYIYRYRYIYIYRPQKELLCTTIVQLDVDPLWLRFRFALKFSPWFLSGRSGVRDCAEVECQGTRRLRKVAGFVEKMVGTRGTSRDIVGIMGLNGM